MSRSLPEWIASSDDAAIPARVKLRVWERCGGKCALTGRKLRPGDAYEFDHIIALANGGRHSEDNLQLVSAAAHREKTNADVALKSKTARIKAKHMGVFPRSPFRIRSRGFEKRRPIEAES